MKQGDYNLISAITTSITVVFAVGFGFWQIKINDRLKKLQDYVAISIVLVDNRLQLINVGKINLYLQKYEIGTDIDAFAKAMLIPAGSNSWLLIQIKNFNSGQKMPIKLYLIDELGEKYLSTGEVIVEPVNIGIHPVEQVVQGVTGNIPAQNIIQFKSSAWAYKMEKYNWKL